MRIKKLIKHGYVYSIKVNEYFKIGFATNIKTRLKSYECHNPKFRIVLIRKVTQCADFEKLLHKEFKNRRFRNEWFKLTKRDVNRLKFLCEEEELKHYKTGDN